MSAKTMIPVLYAAALALGACAANDSVGDSATDGTDTSGNDPRAAAKNRDYFAVEPDAARGDGLLVHAVNLGRTRCGDGTYAAACHVAALDLKALGLGTEEEKYVESAAGRGQLIVRGEVRAELVAREAWVGASEATGAGTFARVTSTGIVCVAAPCPTLHAAELNTGKGNDLAAIDFEAARVSPRQVEGAEETLRDPSGLLVAAKVSTVTGPAGRMPGYLVNQFYLPVRGAVVTTPPPTGCHVGGCSAELCTDEPGAVSSCIYKPEFECFRNATCARQPDLRCGWTPTPELQACLANPPALE